MSGVLQSRTSNMYVAKDKASTIKLKKQPRE